MAHASRSASPVKKDKLLTVSRLIPPAAKFRAKECARFPRRILMAADRKSDNKKVSFDRAILFELFMIPLQMRGMQETKEFDLDLVNKCSARVSPPLTADTN
jgi:hypothetical protein